MNHISIAMDALKLYHEIIKRGKHRELVGYCERHHIVPKCVGGNNDSNNIVKLTAREHFICHRLLIRIYPNNAKIKYAAWAMCNQKSNRKMERTYRITSRTYEILKQNFQLASQNRPRTSRTPEQRLAQSIRQTGKKRNEYRPKPLKFQHTCEECSLNFASADIKGRFCKDCKAPRLCRCGCGKTVKTPGHWYRSGCRLRGKTYTEIYGNILPACGFKTGDQNIAKTIEIRRKISEGVSKSYTPVLLELRRKHCPFNRTKHESNNNKKRII